jgi:hypothetical protein
MAGSASLGDPGDLAGAVSRGALDHMAVTDLLQAFISAEKLVVLAAQTVKDLKAKAEEIKDVETRKAFLAACDRGPDFAAIRHILFDPL